MPIISREEVSRALEKANSPTERWLYFVALLAKTCEIPPDDFIVVGGSAIEVYTNSEYTSGDIDVVSSRAEQLRATLKAWGFKKESRVWWSEEFRFVIEFVRYPYSGDFKKTQIMKTPFGAIRLAAIEDLLVKRLVSTKHWKQQGDFEHARLLAVLYSEQLDWDYIERFAKREDVEDLLKALLAALA